VRLLLFPLIAVVAWLLSSRNGESARKAVRVLSVIVAAIFLVTALTGLARSQPTASSIHKWSGHASVIAVWLFVPFSVGVGLQRNIRHRPGFAVAQTIVLLSSLALVLLASFTGYLAPSHVEDVSEATRNRFTILHLFALPSLIALLLTVWYWLFRPAPIGTGDPDWSPRPIGQTKGVDENPYKSPESDSTMRHESSRWMVPFPWLLKLFQSPRSRRSWRWELFTFLCILAMAFLVRWIKSL
jgi:hypothetical protein